MSINSETKWLDAFAARLLNLEIKRKCIPLATLWTIYAQVLAHRPDTERRRVWLLDALLYAPELLFDLWN